MSQFQVGGRVRIHKPGTPNHGVEATVLKVLVDGCVSVHRDNQSEGSSWDYQPSRLIKLDTPVSLAGKRVKLTLGESIVIGLLQSDRSAWYIVKVDGTNEESSYLKAVWTLEVLPEPIVLPKGKYALVMVTFGTSNKLMRRIDSHTWAETNGHFEREEWVQRAADYNPEGYRVIFEGE